MGTYYPSHNYGPDHAIALGQQPPSSPATKRRRQPSEAQLAANRANARKSTGPRTPEGKSRCSLNAYRHGLTGQVSALTDEDRSARDLFVSPLIADLKPEGALELQIAQSIAEGYWRLSRIRSTEDNIYALGHYGPAAEIDVDHAELHAALTAARVFLESSREMERLTLYEQRIQRGIERHMRELEALQAKRKAERAQALAEAAALLQVAAFNSEAPEQADTSAPNGSVFSVAELRAFTRRAARLKAAVYLEKCRWEPEEGYRIAA